MAQLETHVYKETSFRWTWRADSLSPKIGDIRIPASGQDNHFQELSTSTCYDKFHAWCSSFNLQQGMQPLLRTRGKGIRSCLSFKLASAALSYLLNLFSIAGEGKYISADSCWLFVTNRQLNKQLVQWAICLAVCRESNSSFDIQTHGDLVHNWSL